MNGRPGFVIDAEICFGGGTCALAAPPFFSWKSGSVTTVTASEETLTLALGQTLVDACPSGALSLRPMSKTPGDGVDLLG